MSWWTVQDITLVILLVAAFIDIILKFVALAVVPRNRRPSSGTAWLLAIYFLPYIGWGLFLVIGSRRLPKKRRQKQKRIDEFIAQSFNSADFSEWNNKPEWLKGASALGQNLSALPMMANNKATIHSKYNLIIQRLAETIDTAKDYVHMEFYILNYDETTKPVFEAIKKAVSRGVEVKILLDHIANMTVPGLKKTLSKIEESGAQWSYMLPVRPWRGEYQRPDLRNHRKLLVVDGKTAFMGSQNLIDASYNKKANRRRGLKWKDIMLEIQGPVVAGLDAIFLGDWYLETDEVIDNISIRSLNKDDVSEDTIGDIDCQAIPSGPGFAGENNLQMFLALIHGAKKRIGITSPYFVPDESILYALKAATSRGVSVDLFVSEMGDQKMVYHAQRSYYEDILKAGVRIFMYKPPIILHSKHVSVDDDVAMVGSSNMDMRSFSLNMEISLLMHDRKFVDELKVIEQEYIDNSRELSLSEIKQQSLLKTILDNLARLTSALQ